MEDYNSEHEQTINDNNKQSTTHENYGNQQNNKSGELSESPLETGQTTGGGEDGNWKLTPEISEHQDSSSDNMG